MNELWLVTALIGVMLLVGLVYLVKLPRRALALWGDWQAFQAWRAMQPAPQPKAVEQPRPMADLSHVSLATVSGAGDALEQPPSLALTISHMRQRERARGRTTKALIPFGWNTYQGKPALTYTDLYTENYTLGIAGPTRHGKSRLVFQILRSLADELTPKQLQWCLFDLKEVDFADLAGKAHTWRLVQKADQIPAAIEAINAEIERRAEKLKAARVTDWTDYPGDDLPLFVVYVSELAVMRLVMTPNKLDLWLNDLLGRAAGYGIRTIVDTQNFGTYGTHWREQIKTMIVGPMTSGTQDRPNTGLTTDEIIKAGAIPPSQLPPAKGVFTAISGTHAITIRTVSMSNAERLQWIDSLPDAVKQPEIREIFETRFIASEKPETSFNGFSAAAQEAQKQPELVTPETIALVKKLRNEGKGKTAIIEQVWDARPGGTDKYKQASAAYDAIIKRLDSPPETSHGSLAGVAQAA